MPSGNNDYQPRLAKSSISLPENLDLSGASHLPGLREAQIASSIVNLANQLPKGNPHAEEIRNAAMKLYATSGDQIKSHGEGGKGKSSSPPKRV